MSRTAKKISRKLIPKTYMRLGNVYRDIRKVVNDVEKIRERVDSQDDRLTVLKDLYAQSDPYQPIYGLAGVGQPQRDTNDRCEAKYNYFSKDVDSIRMLDVGCYFGYLSFYLADRGAKVTGWDNNELNIQIANQAQSITGITCNFQTKEFGDESIGNIGKSEYDVVFILSVLHWIIALRGLDYVQDLMKELLDKVPLVIVELAQKGESEDLYWDKAVPKNDLDIFAKVKGAKIKKIGDFPTHLSAKHRPIYAVTKGDVEVNGRHYPVEEMKLKSYSNAPSWRPNIAKYYRGKEYFIKEYSFDEGNDQTLKYVVNEINFYLQNSSSHNKSPINHTPDLVDFSLSKHQARLVLSKFDGNLLCDVVQGLPLAKKTSIVKQILSIMREFEKNGLYHNDLRSWNIMIDKNGGTCLIDMELVSTQEYENSVIAFLWVVNTVLSGARESSQRNKTELPPKKAFIGNDKLLSVYNKVATNKKISFSKLIEEL